MNQGLDFSEANMGLLNPAGKEALSYALEFNRCGFGLNTLS